MNDTKELVFKSGGLVSWLSNVLGRGDDLPRRAAELAERLNRQRSKWLEAVSVECRDGEAVIGAAPASERDPLAAPVMVSAFQAVHVLSMVHANQYVPASEMSRFTTALCTALTNGQMTDAWRRTIEHYTDLKSKPVELRAGVVKVLCDPRAICDAYARDNTRANGTQIAEHFASDRDRDTGA